MARRIAIPSKAVQLKLVGARDSLVIPRVQRLTLTADRPSTDIDELGNRLHAGTVEDIPAITATFQLFDVGIKAFAVLTGTDYNAYPAAGVSVTEITDVDVIAHVKSDSVEDYVKMAHARHCVVRDFTFSYSVDGESTEEYTVVGTKKRWFKNDIVVDKFITGTTSFTLTQTPVQLKDTNYALSAILDGVYLTEVTGAPATGQYRIVGTTLTTGDSRVSQLLVVYQAVPAGTNWSDVRDSSMPAAVRGMDVPVLMAAGGIERVQSVTLNGTFNPEAVKEMGNRDIVGYQMQNIATTGQITVLDTDTELIALLTTGQINPSGVTEFGVDEFTASGISLEIKIQNPADKVFPYTVLKTVYVPEIVVTSEGFTSNVNANAQQTFDIKSKDGDIIIYSGLR
jgi:hypothetical protein